MHSPISEPDLVTLLEEADAAASRLWRRVRLPRADLDDLRQDLLLDLIRRLPAFDARRGSIGAFAGIVLRNQSSRIARACRRERSAIRRPPAVPRRAMRRRERRSPTGSPRTDGPAAWHGGRACRSMRRTARIDLARALGALEACDLTLCAPIAHCPVRSSQDAATARARPSTAASSDLRCALAANGARAA